MLVQPFGFLAPQVSNTPDADAWIAQVTSDGGSLSSTEQAAVRTLETDLKSTTGLYDTLIAIYPLVGGDEASCKYNLKGAADSFTYTLGFVSGSWAFNANGAVNDGQRTSLADTYLSPADIAAAGTGIGLHIYLTVNNQAETSYDLGSDEQSVIAGFGNTTLYGNFNSSSPSYLTSGGQVSGTGDLYSSQHDANGSGTTSVWKNGSSVNSASSQTWTTTNTLSFWLGNDNRGSTPNEGGYKGYGFAGLGNYLDGTQMSGLNTAVQTYNTSLSR
jgi:hypothetical protein